MLFRSFFDFFSIFFSMFCLSILCLFYIFAFLCFVVLCFVIDPLSRLVIAIIWSEAPKKGLPATRPKCICNYFKITAVRAYSNVFLLPIRIGLERRPRLICALVFRAHTEVYECYIYTRRDKTGLSYIIIILS